MLFSFQISLDHELTVVETLFPFACFTEIVAPADYEERSLNCSVACTVYEGIFFLVKLRDRSRTKSLLPLQFLARLYPATRYSNAHIAPTPPLALTTSNVTSYDTPGRNLMNVSNADSVAHASTPSSSTLEHMRGRILSSVQLAVLKLKTKPKKLSTH